MLNPVMLAESHAGLSEVIQLGFVVNFTARTRYLRPPLVQICKIILQLFYYLAVFFHM